MDLSQSKQYIFSLDGEETRLKPKDFLIYLAKDSSISFHRDARILLIKDRHTQKTVDPFFAPIPAAQGQEHLTPMGRFLSLLTGMTVTSAGSDEQGMCYRFESVAGAEGFQKVLVTGPGAEAPTALQVGDEIFLRLDRSTLTFMREGRLLYLKELREARRKEQEEDFSPLDLDKSLSFPMGDDFEAFVDRFSMFIALLTGFAVRASDRIRYTEESTFVQLKLESP